MDDADRIAQLEARVERLEGLLAAFASSISADFRRQEGARAIRNLVATVGERDPDQDVATTISDDARRKVTVEAVRMMRGGGEVSHAELVRAVRGIANSKQVETVMLDLAEIGEVRVEKGKPAGPGRPSVFYQLVHPIA